jgi:DNA-binding IclR family transcriptional regulator
MTQTGSPVELAVVGGAQAISRSVHVLRTVAQLQRSGATASRVAHATGLSRPTVFRMLRALEAERVLERRGTERSYWLGPLAYELGLAARPEAPSRSRWQATVELVASRTRLTSYLIGRSGDEAVCLICIQGATAIRAMPVEVGQRVPLGIGAGSLAIFASLSDDEIDRIIASQSRPVSVFPGGAETRDHLIGRIRHAREAGFSVSSGTVAKGVSGVGVLIPGTSAQLRLALTVSAVAQDIAEIEARKLAEELINAILISM